jgi:hypothetical protein
MARVCSCGCGKELVDKDGNPDYARTRRFFNRECSDNDKREQLKSKRETSKKKGRCSSCMQPRLSAETWKAIRKLAAEAGLDLL